MLLSTRRGVGRLLPRAGARGGRGLVALVLGLVAVLAALLLPFAPVTVSDPLVSWPQDPRAPESTSLLLSAYQPRELTVQLGCAALRDAMASADGVAFATMRPDRQEAGTDGLVVRVAAGRATVALTGRTIADVPVGQGDCSLRLRGTTAGIVVTLDGRQVGRGPDGVLPDVDALVTSVPADPGLRAADLSATVRVNDQFSSSPTPTKLALTVVTIVAALLALASLAPLPGPRRPVLPAGPAPRGGPDPPQAAVGRRRLPRLRPVDVVVLVLLVAWVFLGPMTDDDGYYSAMARNVPAEGYVGQYYQLFNASFAPFTWYYYALAGWQHVAGVSPVVLRVPALVAGILVWVVLRTLVSRVEPTAVAALPAEVGRSARVRAGVRALLAIAFLPWWMAYDMGVRPEAVVAVLTTAVLALVTSALRRGSLVRAGAAVGLATLACVCHPTGLVALGPLLVTVPRLWRLVAVRSSSVLGRVTTVVCLIAPGAVASVAAFADSTWYDFARGQQIFLAVAPQTNWTQEIDRYTYLLSAGPMGSYVKRVVVLLALLGLVWALALTVAGRVRRTPLPAGYELLAASTALGFLLLWVTPSKWTHHFGSLAGVGAAFLATTLAVLPLVTKRLIAERALPWPVVVAGVGSACLVAALSFSGPNDWAYSWMLGMPEAFRTPQLGPLHPSAFLQWVVGSALLAVVVRFALRRRVTRPGPTAGAAVAVAVPVLALAAALVYLVGTFSYATYATWHRYSYSAANLRAPTGCSAAQAVEATDPATARALDPAPGTPPLAASGFAAGGWIPTYAPVAPFGTAAGPTVYGSFVPAADGHDEDSLGSMTSPWWQLPARQPAGSRLTVLVGGRVDATDAAPGGSAIGTADAPGSNQLAVEYGRRTATGFTVLQQRGLGDGIDSPVWRTLTLDPADVPHGADVVRLVAVDGTTGAGGWLAVSAPTEQRVETVQQMVGDATPTALGWQLALWFPCQEQPRIHDGVLQPTTYGVTFETDPIRGLYDWTWRDFRGGLYGQVTRSASVTTLAADVRGAPPPGAPVEVYRFVQPYATDAYTLTERREEVSGLSGPRWGWSMAHVDTTPR